MAAAGTTSGGLAREPLKSTIGVGSRKQRAVCVRHIHFDEHGAGRRIERVCRTRDRSAKAAARKMRNRQRRRLADMHRVDIVLRDVHVRPQGSDLRDPIEQRAACAHERADIHIALRDHAVERRLDQAIPLDLLQTSQIRLTAARLLRCARIAFSKACTLASCAANCARD